MKTIMKTLIVVLHSDYTVKDPKGFPHLNSQALNNYRDDEGFGWYEVIENDGEYFAKSLKIFADRYHLPSIKMVTIKERGGKCGLLDRPHLEAFKQALDKTIAEKVNKIREQLAKPLPDFFEIAQEAWGYRTRDYFFYASRLYPETGIIQVVENALVESFPMYIGQTFTVEY